MWSPGNSWKGMQTTVYRVHTDESITGIGASRGSVQVVNDIVSPMIVGRDPSQVELDLHALSAKAANMALVWYMW